MTERARHHPKKLVCCDSNTEPAAWSHRSCQDVNHEFCLYDFCEYGQSEMARGGSPSHHRKAQKSPEELVWSGPSLRRNPGRKRSLARAQITCLPLRAI
ncbi:hypothetical protein NL676_021947 [Syzygium grande]|nr:hypothetical protein NL676_021947 [Syzygium grande]